MVISFCLIVTLAKSLNSSVLLCLRLKIVRFGDKFFAVLSFCSARSKHYKQECSQEGAEEQAEGGREAAEGRGEGEKVAAMPKSGAQKPSAADDEDMHPTFVIAFQT